MIRLKRDKTRFAESLNGQREAVYVLHGFGGNPWQMHRLARYLRRQNYAVRNYGYRSTRKTISYHAAALRDELDAFLAEKQFQRVHFVAHSMGGIVVRQAVRSDHPPNFGRIVLLAPPNGGSHFARAGAAVFGRLCPVLGEISTTPGSYVRRLGGHAHLEIGVIAASNDWIVRRHNTLLESQRDYIVVRGDHVRLPLLRATAEQTLHFLTTGGFSHQEPGHKPHVRRKSAVIRPSFRQASRPNDRPPAAKSAR